MGAYGNMCMGLRRTIRDGVAKFGRARTKYEEGERFVLSLVNFHRFGLYSSVPKPIVTLPTININAYPGISGFASWPSQQEHQNVPFFFSKKQSIFRLPLQLF
jgi:hypothetical protein